MKIEKEVKKKKLGLGKRNGSSEWSLAKLDVKNPSRTW